jgi:hypothetical protein
MTPKLVEMLEPHLAECSTKENQNFDTLNLSPVESFSTPSYNKKTGELLQLLPSPPLPPAPNMPGKHSAGQTDECHASHSIPPATPG